MPSRHSQDGHMPATVDLTGPFFQGDPGKTFLQNVEKMMQALAVEGAAAAKHNFLEGSATRALVRMTDDRVADHVIGRTTAISGKQWMTAAVVQVSREGLDAAGSRSLFAAASTIARKTKAISSLTR